MAEFCGKLYIYVYKYVRLGLGLGLGNKLAWFSIMNGSV